MLAVSIYKKGGSKVQKAENLNNTERECLTSFSAQDIFTSLYLYIANSCFLTSTEAEPLDSSKICNIGQTALADEQWKSMSVIPLYQAAKKVVTICVELICLT